MNESAAVQALKNGDTDTVDTWVRSTLPTLTPEAFPAPAVRHPLEFICLPLLRSERAGLCLHVWPESGEASSRIIHAHSWDLWSYVVQGTVLNEMVDIRDEPENPEFELYSVVSVGARDEVRTRGRHVSHVPGARQEVPAGRIYRMPAGSFHRSGHRGRTATLVLGEHHDDIDNLVLGPPGGYPGADAPREVCSPVRARELLRSLTPAANTHAGH